MKTRKGWTWWAANAALWLCSILFLLPFLWLLLTAFKPVEQTMKFQWLPRSTKTFLDGELVEVVKERQLMEECVIVSIREGKRAGERLLILAKDWDGQIARIEEREGDQSKVVGRRASLEMEVPRGWWRVREKFLRKYAERQPRWGCVPESQIQERVSFWWENFQLAIEYLSDTEEFPLRSERQVSSTPRPEEAGQPGIPPLPRYALVWSHRKTLDMARYDTLRVRAHAESPVSASLRLSLADGRVIALNPVLQVRPGTQDLNIDLSDRLEDAGLARSCPITALWFEPEALTHQALRFSEARLIDYRATFWTYLRNTLTVCILGCLGTVLSSSLVAYGFSRIQWRGRDQIFWLALATMMVPFPVLMIPLFGVFRDLHWVGTLKPLWVPAFFGSAFNIFLLRQFFLTIPQELSDAARIDGCSELGIYWRIILPLSKPALAVVALFHFLWAWNDFMGPLIYLTRPSTFTLSLALQFYQSQHGGSEWHLLMAMSVLILLPIVAIFFLTQKTFIQGIATTGMKG